MTRFAFYLFISLLLGFIACGTPDPASSAATEDAPLTSEITETPAPNQDNTAIYDVDPDDPYLISNGAFLGLKPGMAVADAEAGLRQGTLSTGEGDFPVYYLDGAEGAELGYLMTDPRDEGAIGDITITSPTVVTEKGVRVGLSFGELQQRVGALRVGGSEIESRTYASADGLHYRLDMDSSEPDIDPATIDPSVLVTEIIIGR